MSSPYEPRHSLPGADADGATATPGTSTGGEATTGAGRHQLPDDHATAPADTGAAPSTVATADGDAPATAVGAALDAPAKERNNVPVVFACLMIGMLMSSLGQMIFSTALPTIVGDLGGVEQMSWIITIFLMTMTIGLPIYGKLGDQIGRKPLYIFALSMFLLGSVIGGFAQNMNMMIVARGVQGIGGGGLMVLSQAIIADVVPARQRGKFMGVMGAVFGLSSVLGPLLGGFFTDGPGWRWTLWFNIPLAIIAIVMAALFLHLPKRATGLDIDVWGTATLAVGTASLILVATWGGRQYDWASAQIIGLSVLTVVCIVAFVLIERRTRSPLIPMHLFGVRNFVLSTVAGFIVGIIMFGTLSYMPTYIQMVHSMSPTRAGLMILPMMVGLMLTSITVGQFVSRTGRYKWFPVLGMVVTAVAMVFMGRLEAHDSLTHLGVILFVYGFGLGCTMQIIVLIVQNAFPVSMVGTATASNNFFRQIGGALGSAVVGSVFTHRLSASIADNAPDAFRAAADEVGPEKAGALAQMFENGGAHNLTPSTLSTLPSAVHEMILQAYNSALTPVFIALAPVVLVAAIVLAFNRQDELAETVE
ncbi:MDR family MFS transporter [Corynebacterium bovis]|uniref:MDR family MFS transporter n=1 Tax=Corynebacterium bovis TaxID=36808 RepID=UPI00313A1BBA